MLLKKLEIQANFKVSFFRLNDTMTRKYNFKDEF